MKLHKLNLNGEDGLNAIIETPRGSKYKFDYDTKTGAFRLKDGLPAGSMFPFDFGFIPSTLGEDGDPIDVLVLMDEPTFSGCVMEVRLVGVIEAKQSDGKKMIRNDRLIAVAQTSNVHRDTTELHAVGKPVLDEITDFFITFNEQKGKRFKPIGHRNAKTARGLVNEAHKRFMKQNKRNRH
jgi:inorganic pyrophosphatase